VDERRQTRNYLIRSDLLPDPKANTPWQVLYNSQNDRAFITTMGLNTATIQFILESGFAAKWYGRPIPRSDGDLLNADADARRAGGTSISDNPDAYLSRSSCPSNVRL
ncbi:hypothetical protein EWM64_g10778, partial [Hericium alpestre]